MKKVFFPFLLDERSEGEPVSGWGGEGGAWGQKKTKAIEKRTNQRLQIRHVTDLLNCL